MRLALLLLPFLMAGCLTAGAAESRPVDATAIFDALQAAREADLRQDSKLDALDTQLKSISTDIQGLLARQEDQTQILTKLDANHTVQAIADNVASLVPPSTAEPVEMITDSTGQAWDLKEFIANNYKRAWNWTGDLTEHLASEHGVDLQTDLDDETKQQLHAAIHERELALADPTPLAGVTSDCPDGKCPLRSREVTISKPGTNRTVSSQVYVTPSTSSTSNTVRTYSYFRPLGKAASRKANRCYGPNCCR